MIAHWEVIAGLLREHLREGLHSRHFLERTLNVFDRQVHGHAWTGRRGSGALDLLKNSSTDSRVTCFLAVGLHSA